MIRKKKIFQDESIKALALRIVPPLFLAFRIRRKKKSIVLPFIVSRTITDRQETEVDSREKKKPLEYSLLASRRLPGVNAQTASNGRAFLFEFPAPLLRIICHFTGGNSFLPSPPPPPLHYLVRADRLEARPNL